MTHSIAPLNSFLKGLTVDSIDKAIARFRDGLDTRRVLPIDFDPGRAQMACNRILDLTVNGSIMMDDIRKVPKLWVNLEALAHNSNLNALESCITRVFCMQGALTLHRWLQEVVPQAVERSSRNTWIDKLVWDVDTAIYNKQSISFHSEDYIPNLTLPSTFIFLPKKFSYEHKEVLITIVTSIIKKWLQFPADELSLVQLSLIDEISSKSLPSVMFLDKIWEAYKTPFPTIFKKCEICRTKNKMDQELKAFYQEYAHHPFTTPGSLEYQKLEELEKLIQAWLNNENESDKVRIDLDLF